MDGIQALLQSLDDGEDVIFLFSALKDKNFEAMLDLLKQRSKDVYVTLFENKRAFQKADIAQKAFFYEDYRQALDALWNQSTRVVVTGSLYFISEVRAYLLNK